MKNLAAFAGAVAIALAGVASGASAAPSVSGTAVVDFDHGLQFPRNKQNEPSCAVSSRNLKNIICGVNDYRGVDWMKLTDGKAGAPFVSVLMSADGGVSFKGTLHPGCPESDPATSCP